MSKNEFKAIFSNKMNVAIDDINYGNHLCHSKFISILHNTRALFLKKHNLSELNCFGCGLVMLNLNIDYKNSCYFDDELEIGLRVERIDKVSVVFSYLMFNRTRGKLAATAETVMGVVDLEKGKLVRVPEEFLALVAACIK